MGTDPSAAPLKTVPLDSFHRHHGAKMVPFAGYEMPVQYKAGIMTEHTHTRTKAGLFDVSHMGEFFVRGPQALDLIQRISTNDASKLTPGKIQYSCMPNEDGGIVDDLLVYCISEVEYMLVVNGSNLEKDWAWVNKHNTFECTLENRSDKISLLAIQGPKAVEFLQQFTDTNLSEITYYTFEHGRFCGVDDILISATGYTGSGGFEIYMPNAAAHQIWDTLIGSGLKPAGLGARDTLRLEMGYCLYGNDIDETTSPIEAGLGWITKFTKDFINATALAVQKEAKPARRLVAFELNERGIPRQGYDIIDADGNIIGNVTSGTMSPCLQKGIGMGYVAGAFAKSGTQIHVQIRKKAIPATVVKLPFYKG